ncbi:ATPase family associated with various cellular activities (AAA) [Nesidiocoris tenuis]|uniref:ATPase family associated with various cellular activities (AAA) n=1 Tax=Nesidiocoris tenuis TaxID=355587 RepID=A0ABN7B398_9HEMI|nr:ATPase family associated with various cellular activities (AAA) [Nesidiocoris tenuis]
MSTEKFVHASTKRLIENLKSVLAEDEAWQSMEPIADIDHAQWLVSKLYVKFILVTNSLTKLLNMTVNYQKRERLKPLVSDLFCRIVELKAELAKISKTDYPYLDDVLMELHVTRRAMEIDIPDYFRFERSFVVKEFVRFAEKIKNGSVLRPFPKKPVPEMALDLRRFCIEEAKLAELLEGEMEGKRIEREQIESKKNLKNFSSMTLARVKRPQKVAQDESGEMRKIIEMMGCKREDVFRAMRAVAKQPLTEPYESWKFPFARDLVRPPYFQGKKYFSGYDKLVNPVEYGKFLRAIALFQKHERARVGGIYFLIKKERFEKMFVIIRNRRKGLPTELKTKDDFHYPIQFRDYSAVRRKTIRAMPAFARKADLTLAALGLLPQPRKDRDICDMHRQYKSQLRKLVEHNMMAVIQAEVTGMQELSRGEDLKELDIVDEIIEYFTTWHHASKPMAAKIGWDLLDLPSPDKKLLPPPAFVAGIPKSLTDEYVEKNFDKLTPALQRRPPYAGSALIVSGNHITKEKYMSVKTLALARQAMPKEAREAEAQKAKEQKAKEKEAANKNKKGEDPGYTPQKSQIPLLALHRTNELSIAIQYEEDEIHPLIVPKLVDTQGIDWEVATGVHLKIREGVDKKMIAFQKQVRQQMVKKHRKAENLQKRKIPGMYTDFFLPSVAFF